MSEPRGPVEHPGGFINDWTDRERGAYLLGQQTSVREKDAEITQLQSRLETRTNEVNAYALENERLRTDYERMWSALQAETATGVQVRGELRTEIERLRAALSRILESFTEPEDDNGIIRQARAALNA